MLKEILERGDALSDEGMVQNNFQAFGFKDDKQALKWLRMLENLYQMVHEQKHRMSSLHRWIEQDLINGDPNGWAKSSLLVAMKVFHAHIDPKNPKMVEFNSFQRYIWTTFLEETEDIFADIQIQTDEILEIFESNELPLAKTTSFESDFDFRPNLERLSDWFNEWHGGVKLLREAYKAIPSYPKASSVHYFNMGHSSKEPSYDISSRSSIFSSFDIYEPPSTQRDISTPLRVEQLAYDPDSDIPCTNANSDGGISKIPEVSVLDFSKKLTLLKTRVLTGG
ncbi:hypothetical protein AA313_de0205134 [Arthrobotrys entomopaga]|nr:hypothetical protein AA313_de0205134 [Arthrobotrys entomopaga]